MPGLFFRDGQALFRLRSTKLALAGAQMFGQRHGMKFKVRQERKSVLVDRLA